VEAHQNGAHSAQRG